MFEWKEYQDLARILCGYDPRTNFKDKESALRSSVSRAYYAAYCSSRNYAQEYLGFIPKRKSDDHERLIEHYKNKGYESIATELDSLRFWRNQCDYENNINTNNLSWMVKNSITYSHRVFSNLKCLSDILQTSSG